MEITTWFKASALLNIFLLAYPNTPKNATANCNRSCQMLSQTYAVRKKILHYHALLSFMPVLEVKLWRLMCHLPGWNQFRPSVSFASARFSLPKKAVASKWTQRKSKAPLWIPTTRKFYCFKKWGKKKKKTHEVKQPTFLLDIFKTTNKWGNCSCLQALSSDLIPLTKTNLHNTKHLSNKNNLNHSNSKCELTNFLY